MTSIFDLKTDVSELSSANQGTSSMSYEQHPPTRDVVGNNFSNGAIHFRWQTSGQKWWIPNRSYIRMRCSLSKADGTQLTKVDNIAPNMGLASSLFQSAEFRINDKTVSRISDFMPQVDALETRLSKSRSWLEGLGASVNFWDDEFKVRQSVTAVDGVLIDQKTDSTLQNPPLTRPALGFDAAGGAQADRNQWAYTSLTGALVYTQGTDGNGLTPANASLAFPVGSYFLWTVIQGAGVTDARLNRPAKVLTNDGAGNLTLETGIIVGDVATDGRDDFSKITVVGEDALNDARKVINFEISWCPPLSMFKVGHAIPSGKYELVLNPQTASVYQKYAIESVGGDKIPNISSGVATPGSQFKFNIADMYLYVNTIEGPRADDITYLLDLEQTRCQSDKIEVPGFGQKNFDVSPSTYALSVAYQDARAGTDTRYSASKMRSYGAVGPGGGSRPLDEPQEQKLTRFFINYAGKNLPSPDADPEFEGGKDYTTQRYVESQIYSGAFYDSGGSESLDESQAWKLLLFLVAS